MRYFKRAGGPGRGVFPEDQRHIPMINRCDATISTGAIVMIDEQMSHTLSTNMTPGAESSGFGHVVVPTAGTALANGTFMVYEGPSDLADDAEGLFTLVGIIDCDVENGAVAQTDLLLPQASLELDRQAALSAANAGQKVIAKPLEARAASPGTALVECFFNGYGFGVFASSTT